MGLSETHPSFSGRDYGPQDSQTTQLLNPNFTTGFLTFHLF